MNRKFFSLAVLAAMFLPALSRAQLRFSIVPTNVLNFAGSLNAASLGNTNLAAVGRNSVALTATLTNANGGIDLFTTNAAWTANHVPTNNGLNFLNLDAVTYGPGFFVASGSNNVIFTWTNGSLWTANGRALGKSSTVETRGLAFAGNNFVLAPSTVEMAYSAAGGVGSTWTVGAISNASFLESYRAVAPYGPNGFALCGVSGTVRYSTNDGAAWLPSQPYNFADSNYLGIATDGSSNIVCVGQGGAIKYCTNGGFADTAETPGGTNTNWFFASTTWQTNLAGLLGLPALTSSALELNAVTFAGTNNGFIAAGDYQSSTIDFGFVIFSTDRGASWTLETNFMANQPGALSVIAKGPQTNMYSMYQTNALALTNKSLFGANFGLVTSYSLGNLAILVGENGTVILGGDIPAPPTNPISQTNYAGFQCTNLAVTVPSFVTADWYWQSPSGGLVLVGAGVTNFAPPPIPNWLGNNLYMSNYFVFARDGRTGFVSTNSVTATLVTRPRPTAFNSFSTNVCNGEAAVLYANLSGLGPDWNNLVWSDGTNETATSSSWMRTVFSAEITNVLDNAPTTFIFTITNLADQYTNIISYPSGAASYPNQPGDLISTNIVTVNPRPQAAIIGTNTVCNGQPFTFTVLLKGQAPWTVELSDGSILNVSASSVTNVGALGWAAATDVTRFPGNPLDNCPVTTNYSVVSVMDSSGCSSYSTDVSGAAQATVNPRPQVAVVGTNSVCNGQPFTFAVLLKGQAPWTVPLSDGSVLTVSSAFVTNITCSGWAAVTNVTRFPTNSLDNCVAITNYSAISVTDDATGCTNEPTDITGSAEVMVIPRPKVAVVGTNTVCNGQPFTFEVLLSGQAPWTVQLSDNSTVTVSSAFITNNGCTGWAAVTNVTRFPTNTFLNTAITTHYSALSVSNTASGCTNDPNDIMGSAQVTIDPRPTAILLSTNLPHYMFGATNCNYGVSYTITNLLNGFGPWTIDWMSNGQQVVQYATNILNGGAGPYTNLFTVYPTNDLGVNSSSNNAYYILGITNSDNCAGNQPGDILGTNTIVINPVPTLAFNIATNDFAAFGGRHGGAREKVNVSSNSVGVLFVQTAFTSGSNTLYMTNHLQLTGLLPLHDVVVWQEIGADPTGLNMQTIYLTNTYTSTNAKSVITNEIFDTTPGTNFTITALLCSNVDSTCFEPLTNSVAVFVNAANSASVSIVGQDTNQISVCGNGSDPAMIQVDLGGSGPWTVWWNDGTTNIIPNAGDLPLIRTLMLTNLTSVPFTNVLWVTNVSDFNSTNSFTSNDTGIAVVAVDPFDTNAPLTFGDVTNCSDVAVALTVSVPAGFTADWYADSNLTMMLESSTTNYVPAVTNVAGTNTYYAVARFNDPNLASTCISPATNVTLISQVCTNQISSITLSGTNAVIQWSGDYILLQSSNLVPAYWTVVTQGVVGLNLFTNPIAPPPTNDFFLLYAPTNYPYPTNFGP